MNSLSLVEKIACLNSQDKDYLESLVDRFLATPSPKGCGCHVVDPKKQNMIIWPSQNPKHPNDLIVQFTNQKMIGMPRVDKRGQKYWKVRSFYEDEEPEIASKLEVNQSLSDYSPNKIDRLAKFRERQAKTQQLASPKETKWLTAEEHEARLVQEKVAQENQKELNNHASN